MNKQDMLKVQTCVLKVNIHCDGCKDKVKKKLQKIQGVYKVSIDVEQGKVMVSGNVDPEILLEKLEKAGKHAELWGAPKGQISLNNNQFMNFRNENVFGGKDNKSQKGGKDQQKGGHQVPSQFQPNKGSKDLKFLGKPQKSVKFHASEDEFDDDSEDDFDDEFDGEFDDEFGARQPFNKVVNGSGGHGPPPKSNATSNGHQKGNKGAANNNGGTGKKGGSGLDTFLRGLMGKGRGKNGNGGKNSSTEKGNQKQGNGQKGVKNGGFVLGEGKHGAKNGGFIHGEGKDVAKNGGKGVQNNDSWSKKGGVDKLGGVPKLDHKQKEFPEMNGNHGKNMMGNYPMGQTGNYPMGQIGNYPMGNFPVPQGLPPAAAAMNLGHFPAGMAQGNPYSQQQQYLAQMMMMNQQRGNGHDMYHPMMFNRMQPPAMNYAPQPPASDRFTHIFSDENTDSCSIM